MSKVVVITGTSTGLGLTAAVLFAKNGFTVYVTMRNLAKKIYYYTPHGIKK